MAIAGVEFQDDSAAVRVRGFLHRAEAVSSNGLVLTHGAGANCRSALLTALAEAFREAGVSVLRCDLPFRQARPFGPPMRGGAEKDQEGLCAAVEVLKKHVSGKIFLGGHSYGGRQASILASRRPDLAEALLLLSYPLHPPDKPQQMRTDHFPSLGTPTLFISGERDGFGTRKELEDATQMIPARNALMMVAGAGHELMGKKNQQALCSQIVASFISFIDPA